MASHSARVSRILNRIRTPWACVVMLLVGITPLSAQAPYGQFEEYDLLMYDQPNLRVQVRTQVQFPEGLIELWQRALDRPDPQLQRLIIDTLAVAHRRGVPDVQTLQPKLIAMSQAPNQPLDIARSLSQTLIALDARDQAERLANLAAKYGPPVARIVEPALAEWRSPVLESQWVERVRSASAGTESLNHAIEGLVAIQSPEASELLERLIRDVNVPISVRMTAGRGLGQLHQTGMVDMARELSESKSESQTIESILAVQLLERHTDAEAIALLTRLLDSDSTAVQAESLKQLYRIDYKLVDQQCDRLIDSKDANVRRLCLQALVDTKQASRIALISRFLDDINPLLRRQASQSLIELAEIEGMRTTILAETVKVLEQESWRGCEQASVVMARLDHKPSGPRLVQLLGHPRGDVQVAAAWALTKLRMPDLLPDMLDHAESVYEGFRAGTLNDSMRGASLHLAHLFVAFGDQRFSPSEELMRQYIPKNFALGLESRVAAVWALGMLHEGEPDAELVEAFLGRLRDNGMFPEIGDVRNMSGVSLGRMKAESALPDLRQFAGDGLTGCQWAVEQMTGEKPPEMKPQIIPIDDWFLAPLPK